MAARGPSEALTDEAQDNYADFERAVLQDNINLCDQKSGILLAFTAAMVLVCIQGFGGSMTRQAGDPATLLLRGAFLAAGAAFLVSSYFALSTITPRMRTGPDDHIFWESAPFKLPVDDYVRSVESAGADDFRRDRLVYLHKLADICRGKFAHFRLAFRLALVGFLVVIVAELVQAVS